MVHRAALALLLAVAAAGSAGSNEPMPGQPPADQFLFARLPSGTQVRPVAFAGITGWREDDHAAAFLAFLETCAPILDGTATLRDALPTPAALIEACLAARSLRQRSLHQEGDTLRKTIRRFFEAHFDAVEIRPNGSEGFLTAYFEPEIEASLEKTIEFSVPVLARPADLVTLKQGETRPGLDPVLQAARQTASGLEPYPDRAAIWAGALEGKGLEIAWLRDQTELFITQVQGSARLRLPDGSRTRLVYSGRNGHPYTSIGKRLVETGEIPLAEMSLAKLMGWLRANPSHGQALMEENRSYVFFARDDAAPQDRGPIGGAGVPLTPGRSLAIDRTFWPYGLPVYIEADPLTPEGGRSRIARLMVAQDTGSAITGPARGDYFMGTGAKAGERAGLVRDAMRFIILSPRLLPHSATP